MPTTPAQILIGGLLAVAVAAASWRLGFLTRGGAIAAVVVGTIVFGLGGLAFSVPLLSFFVTSSVLGRIENRHKAAARQAYAKGGARDAGQVVANGAVPAMLVALAALMPPERVPSTRDWMLLYLCAVASANADTWATEVGGLLRSSPRMITSWRRVASGTSGAVTAIGTAAAFAGAALVPIVGWVSWPAHSGFFLWRPDAAEMLAVAWVGALASLVDSVLGAGLQAQYICRECGRTVESPVHCGAGAPRVRGLAWMDNDAVNLVSQVVAVLCGWYLLRSFAWVL